MASSAIVIKGTSVNVGFQNVTYSNFVMEDSSEEPTADVEEIRDVNNCVGTKLISGPGRRYKVSGVVLNAGTEMTTLRALVKGSTVSINSVSCMVEEIALTYNRGAVKCSITAIKEDSMTYT